ncbi:MAG: ABC transporter ATP-binding protein [SAR324 cluster bacterium]|nr:ABC transporter ATP-binding protein [SAR324 cluster bacterium]
MTKPILEINNLSVSFFTRHGKIPAVMDFSMTVHAGEAMGLVGESGCGKSTVALAVMRYLGDNGKITSGSIRFKGRDVTSMSETELRELRGSQVSMIYQEPMASLNPAMRVGQQLMEVPLSHEIISNDEAQQRSLEMLESVRLPDPERIFRSYPHQISGGQQQRIVIAMALLSKPALLLLDEPTTALDVTVEAGIVALVRELGQQFGTSMLFVSHNLGLILETCDRITVMYSGEAVESGPIREVFRKMRHPYTQGLLRSIPLPGTDKTARPLIPIPGQLPLPHERPQGCNFGPRCASFQGGICDKQEIMMSSVSASGHFSRCSRVAEIDWDAVPESSSSVEKMAVGDTILAVRNLSKRYDVAANSLFGGKNTGSVKANEQLNFNAKKGEIVAIVGESGCGKSTLAKILLGLEEASEGSAYFAETSGAEGVNLAHSPVESRNIKTVGHLQIVFQNPFDTLNPSHTIGNQIVRALEKFGIGKTPQERREQMLELLDLVKLPREFERRIPRQLSGGQKQRVGIARAFAGKPSLVVADEPVSALDVSVQAAVTELLTDIQRKDRTTLLFISHDLSMVRYLADRVIVMYLGRIVEQGTADEVYSPPYHPYTEALLSAVPVADPNIVKEHIILVGDIPSALNPPSGCAFHTRCHRKIEGVCDSELPPKKDFSTDHHVHCHLSVETLLTMNSVFRIENNENNNNKEVVSPVQ